MKAVWVVTKFLAYEYEHPEIVFSTREAADEYMASHKPTYQSEGLDIYEVEFQ